MGKARLEEKYNNEIRASLAQDLGIVNVMEVPKISKIVINIGVKDAVSDTKVLQLGIDALAKITGQLPLRTKARKSIAGFKLRAGMPIGAKVTMRKKNMYEFLDRLISLALPKVRDFQGVPAGFDGRGSYNLGIKEMSIFPEISYEVGEKVRGMNITICTTAKTDEQGVELLKKFGMPFRKP